MSTTLQYPYRWGKKPVNAFVEKYARGTYILAKMLDISPGLVRHGLIMWLCSGNSLRYEALKRVIKGLNDNQWVDYKPLDKATRHELYKRLLWMAEDEALDANITQNGY